MSASERHTLARSVSLAATVAFATLSVAVATGLTQPLDDATRQRVRPDDTWGTIQQHLIPVIDGFEPRRGFFLLLVVGLGLTVARASWRPVLYVTLAGLTASAATVLSKYAIGRADPGLERYGGGSYPSGHMVAALVSVGCIALLLLARTRWWTWLAVGLVGATMGTALVVTAAHWLTDVIGGTLLAVAVLAGITPLSLRGDPVRRLAARGDPARRR